MMFLWCWALHVLAHLFLKILWTYNKIFLYYHQYNFMHILWIGLRQSVNPSCVNFSRLVCWIIEFIYSNWKNVPLKRIDLVPAFFFEIIGVLAITLTLLHLRKNIQSDFEKLIAPLSTYKSNPTTFHQKMISYEISLLVWTENSKKSQSEKTSKCLSETFRAHKLQLKKYFQNLWSSILYVYWLFFETNYQFMNP